VLGSECTIVIDRLEDGWYRASCPLFPDCEAVAATEADARQAVAEAIDRILRQREATRDVRKSP
jgi:predicted RNase H-like HicB family nuclease